MSSSMFVRPFSLEFLFLVSYFKDSFLDGEGQVLWRKIVKNGIIIGIIKQ